jgi:multidrug efflux system membrane fusion protein
VAAAAAAATLAAATVARAEKSAPAQKQAPTQPAAPAKTEPAPPVKPATQPVRAETVVTTRRRGSGWLVWLIVLVVLAAAGVFAFLHFHHPASDTSTAGAAAGKGHHGSDLPRVTTAVAATGDIPVYLTGLGAVTPLNTVTVQSRVSGQLMKVLYTEGQMVKEGELLLQIDSRPYEAQIEQYKATKEHDEALLENALIDDQRYQTLWQQNSIPQQTLATQESLVKQDQATVDTDQALIDATQLNITYCNITSPISGRVGLRLIDVGNYVQATSSTGLVVITQIQPITVIFTIPEDNIDAVTGPMNAGQTLEVDAFPRAGFFQNGATSGPLVSKLASGTLLTIDNQIDPTTGTVKLRATFPNTDNALFPNQFVNTRMLVDTEKNVVTVPVAAVQHGTGNATFVYILDPQAKTVKLQNITEGTISFDGSTAEIKSGVNAGDTVVTDGVDKLKDGSKVIVSKPAASTDDSAPTTDSATGPASSGQKHHHHKKPPSGDTNAAPAS